MSTLKTHNLQSSDSGSVNIALAPNAGMVVAGVSTFADNVDFSSSINVTGDVIATGQIFGKDLILSDTTPVIHLTDSTANPDYQINNTNGVFNIRDTTNGVDRIVVNTDGKVGLGTTGSDYALSIREADNNNKFLMLQKNSGQELLQIREDGSNHIIIDGSHASGELHFYTAGSERLLIDSNGKVKMTSTTANQRGLSVIAPQTQIQFGTANDVGGFLMSSNNGQFGLSGGGYWTGSNWVAKHTASVQIRHDGAGDMVFCTNSSLTSGNNFTPSEVLKINSDGYLTLNGITRPTVGHTGNEPLINGFSSSFYHEVHRCITDMRSLCEGTHAGYILLVPAWPGSNTAGKKFYGTIMCDRGNAGGGNSTQVAKIHASTAYNNDKFYVEVDRHSQYICGASKVTYGGVAYLAVRFNSGGGGPTYKVYVDGKHRGTDSNFLRVVRENEVTVDDKHYGALATNPSGPPICGAFIKNMTGSTFDSGVLEGGNVVYQYAPSGQNSPYNSGDGTFTARVNGLYLVTGGILVQHNTGRLEGKLEWYDGSSWQTYVNFNGTGTTYDGPTFTVMIPLKEGYAIRMARSSGNAYNSAHPNHYFGVHLLNALERDDVPH